MKEIIIAVILFLISLGTFIMSVRSFMEKGFLFNNAYIYASKEERARMDKKPHYRQSAIVFLMLCITFLLLGIMTLTEAFWLFYVVIAIAVVAIVYAFVSGAAIEQKKDQNK